jgi:hypothetical protein
MDPDEQIPEEFLAYPEGWAREGAGEDNGQAP